MSKHAVGVDRYKEVTRDDAMVANLIENLALTLLRLSRAGVIVTVEQVAQTPLAMGNYKTVVKLRRTIDHVGEAAKRGGYTICPNCQRAAGQGGCDWIECDDHSPREVQP